MHRLKNMHKSKSEHANKSVVHSSSGSDVSRDNKIQTLIRKKNHGGHAHLDGSGKVKVSHSRVSGCNKNM